MKIQNIWTKKLKIIMLKWLNGDMLNFLLQYTTEIYLNTEHPENHTVKKSTIKDCLDVMIDNKFQAYHKDLIYQMMSKNTEPVIFEIAKDTKKFTKKICRSIHSKIVPFTRWKDIGYKDIQDNDNP